MVELPRAGAAARFVSDGEWGWHRLSLCDGREDTDRGSPSHFWSVRISQRIDLMLYHPRMPTPRRDQRGGHQQPQAGPFAPRSRRLIQPCPTRTPLVSLQT